MAVNKIFGLGMCKTGTTSLHRALKQLGFRSVHYPRLPEILSGQFDWMDDYDAASDIPIVPFYPQLDAAYPGSKFILTVRNVDEWLQSMEKWWGAEATTEYIIDIRLAVFGINTFRADRLKYVYEKHLRDVREYFKNRPDDLLIMNICEGDGWEKLCPFLKKSAPDVKFPFIVPEPRTYPEKPKRRGWLGFVKLSR